MDCFIDSISINEKLMDLDGQAKILSYVESILTTLEDLERVVAAHKVRVQIAQKMNNIR
jgi:hypothetical protein